MALNYYLPISGPSNYVVTIGGNKYVLQQENPDAPLGLQ